MKNKYVFLVFLLLNVVVQAGGKGGKQKKLEQPIKLVTVAQVAVAHQKKGPNPWHKDVQNQKKKVVVPPQQAPDNDQPVPKQPNMGQFAQNDKFKDLRELLEFLRDARDDDHDEEFFHE